MVNLTHEQSLLQEIEQLAGKGKIHDSAGLTPQGIGSKLKSQDAELEIKWLIPTTRQRLNATKLYLDLMEHIDFDYYLRIPVPLDSESSLPSKDFIDFSDHGIVNIQIKLLENNYIVHRETSALVVFTVLNGFFSNLVSLEDCVAKIINIVYDLHHNDRESYKIRQMLKNKLPNGNLTIHLGNFHVVDQNGNLDKTGSPFNIAKQIRNQLIHGNIDSVVVSPILLSGFPPDKLYFQSSFFPTNMNRTGTEITTFCNSVFKETVDFIDECYKLILGELQNSGYLPV
ncbi:MAG: hypothetical protein OXU23_10580 [Candidatus Poribacteria bacterium]|nr:hypothetical protein [Candidatus Poribacteria bacterium]